MSSRIIFLLLLCMLAAFFIDNSPLLMLLGAALFILILSDMATKKPVKKSGGAPKEQEIIYPVIYEDTGESPYLFPKKFEVKGYPEAKGGSGPIWGSGLKAAGELGKMLVTAIKPAPKSPDDKDKKK